MGNICSTRDESDLREKDKRSSMVSQTNDNTQSMVSQKNVFKANPKGREPEYIIESKMSLAMAAQEHLDKIQNERANIGLEDPKKEILDANGSFGGNISPLQQNTSEENKTLNKQTFRQEIVFDGTFKPKTHLNNNMYNPGADENGMQYGTFGGQQLSSRVPNQRQSYQIDTIEGNNAGMSFHVKSGNQ